MSNTYDTEPRGIVKGVFKMDPREEVLLRGEQLDDGMRVLIEDSLTRGGTYRGWSETDDYQNQRLIEGARWCTVKDLRRSPDNLEVISFIGHYDDGHEAKRSYHKSYMWYVKIGSISRDRLQFL